MKDTLISFETAKLAKEKGVELDIDGLYWEDGSYDSGENALIYEEFQGVVSAPTQSLLQKWLREVHKINIFISSKTIENKTIFIPHGRTIPDTIKNNLIVDIIQYCTNNTYEEALEIALFEALKLI